MADNLDQPAQRALERSAEQLAEVLTATAGELARRTEPIPTTAAEPDVVDLLGNLARLRTLSQRLQQDLMTGAQVSDQRWEELAQVFDAAARECRQQVADMIVPGDMADPGTETD